MAIRVGCGSWTDAEYEGVLYPPKLPVKDQLKEYAKHLNLVEVNSSYYRVPSRKAVEKWVKETPANFTFDMKLHRNLFSSLLKAKSSGTEPEKDFLAYTIEQMEPLIQKGRLGLFLLLLPTTFKPGKGSLKDLDAVVERMGPHQLAIEFRHRGWVEGKNREATLSYFRERGIAWVNVDMPPLNDTSILPPSNEVTQPKFAYLRLHGRNPKYLESATAAERHDYLYNEKELKEISKRVRQLADQAEHVHVIANNHAKDYAPRTALALQGLLGKKRKI